MPFAAASAILSLSVAQEEELQEEARLKLSPEEMKKKLLDKLRDTNAGISSVKKEIKKAKVEVQQAEDRVEKARNDLEAAKKMKVVHIRKP